MIIYQDHNWIAVNKPTGLATYGGQPGELGAVEWLALHLGITSHVVSRLDTGTSGVLLLARHPAASGQAQHIHEENTALKIYEFMAATDSRALGLGDTWRRDDPLDDQSASTVFRRCPLDHSDGLVRYTAEITRGRRHQIRRHAALSGVAIMGDDAYGGAPAGRLCLHCAEVRWPGIEGPIRAPVPPSFEIAAKGAGPALDWAVCRDRRGAWPAQVSDCWRAVHRGEIPGLDAAIEVYGPWLRAVSYDECRHEDEAAERLSPLLETILADTGGRGAVIRGHRQNPHQESLVAFTRTVGEPPPPLITVTEHALQYEIDLTGAPHPGLFLDQRDTRRRVALASANRRMANLFAFTCSFSTVAVAHGAEVAFSVDAARGCLRTGARNFALNGLEAEGRGKFVQEDVRKWLARQQRAMNERRDSFRPFDLIVCDPPVFSAVKGGGRFSVATEWNELAATIAPLLAADGDAVFANNHRGGDHRKYRDGLREHFADVKDLRPPIDFPLLPDQPREVRTFWCRR